MMHQLYYFPNDRKYALFTLIYRYKPTKIAPISHASTKNVFKNVFTKMVLNRCYIS